MQQYLCLHCVHYIEEELEGYYRNVTPNYVRYEPPTAVARCKTLHQVIIVLRKRCPHYLSTKQTTIQVGDKGMVKIGQIPSEGERLELSDLPKEIELIALSETFKEANGGKTGGLVIKYQVRDGRTFDQKYTKLSGHVLVTALKKLKIDDTVDLQKNWYIYNLTPMRMGFPRMIPVKKATQQ